MLFRSVKDTEGNVIVEKTTEKTAQWFAVSSSKFAEGETYTVCAGDVAKEVDLERIVQDASLE